MSLLVIGSTGTLGRQIVRKALNAGFQVKCVVRNFRKAAFLKEWGAELIYGDLNLPETIPLALFGVTSIIDCSTTRPNDLYNIKLIDLKAKYILIEAGIKANIKRYIFFSILNAFQYKNIMLVNLKLLIEQRLRKANINYTIFSLPGFFQGIIPQYALPILDKNSIWITKESSLIPYINTQDVAKITIKSLSISQFQNKKLPIIGNKKWTSFEIIELCEKISGKRAKTTQVPIYILKLMTFITRLFQWTWNISERLEFTEIISKNQSIDISMREILYLLKIDDQELESLEFYLQEYFQCIMKKLKELNYESLNEASRMDKLNF
uniref:NmrA-like domain-containing protein n=1 Tax=Ophidocladus simpliciusculus TaxID=1261574 RepID=A0A1Z1MIS5_9FLOR|nr:hypothetical protein [Ophidocladus simpliciusculus]ARW65980.1 hypothetical protein [Ophidocladus simpliciusculus]